MPKKHERLIWLLLIGIAAFNKVDYMMTLQFLRQGFYEANPFLAPLVGTIFFPALKLIAVPLLLLYLWRMRHQIGRKLVSYLWVPFLSYSTLMIYFRILMVR